MNAPTIVKIVATAPSAQSLWAYLMSIPTSLEASIFYAMMIGCVFGIGANYTRLWASDQITGGFFDYLFHQYPRRTLLAIFAAASWSVGEVSMGIYQGSAGELFSWSLVLVSGFKNGFTGDALANKGSAANAAKPPTS